MTSPTVDAIVLAGGTARRMGGVDKPALTVGRKSLVQRAVEATAGCRRTVVVGPPRTDIDAGVLQVREEPAGSGPVAATAAGLAALGTPAADVVVVMAADLPFVDARTVAALVDALVGADTRHETSVVFAADDTGRTQYLLAAWDGKVLSAALSDAAALDNASVRSIVPAGHVTVSLADVDDCDTAEDLRRARSRVAADAARRPVPDLDEARAVIRSTLSPLTPRRLPPTDAERTVLAEPLIAIAALPPVDISAMDGYAVAGEAPWTVRSDIAYAGTSGLAPLAFGDAVRIATGAAVPAGATGVVRDEHVVLGSDGGLTRIPDQPVRDDRRRRGEDWHDGTELLPSGTPMSTAAVSVAVAAEVPVVAVRGPVRARVILSGNEIQSSGSLDAGQTRDSIGPVLPRYLLACGIDVIDTVHLPDTPNAFDDALAEPGGADLLVVVGATGGGVADRLRASLIDADAHIVVSRVRVRPGGSQITAVLPTGLVVLGLPGNPLAAVSTAMTTAPAVVDALTARIPSAPRLGLLADAESLDATVTRIVPVRSEGTVWSADTRVRTAHLLHLTWNDALAVVPPHVTADMPVELLYLPH